MFHLPGWGELPGEEFRQQVSAAAAGEGWVIDGNYQAVLDLVWERADTVVWLDLPRRTVMYRVVTRTLRRVLLRRELWNGNREPWSNLFSVDPMKSVIAWSWTRHGVYRERYGAAVNDPAWQRLTFLRLRARRDVEELIGA
jgi:adenylate kinase family enzyme